ncbi:MAG: cofactor-independent phosphoglycerate mutase [Eubacterium sp.]|jgi:2,3-bisphosphoglycerate-independent phosphoglycerate mutase|nr:cofactor-independent phosphoglycerate mutase [Eubacterium sp.]
MKYLVILGDGMADRPIKALGDLTPLAYAKTPMMDQLAAKGEIGMVHTIPDGMSPGSDTANLSVLGYDPRKYYSGRSPLEALSIGVSMKETDIALRCNLVTLSEEEGGFDLCSMKDHSAGEISTEDAKILLDAVRKEIETEEFRFYAGTSYRHLLIWENGSVMDLAPPHDILGQKIEGKLPKQPDLLAMTKRSYEILKDHPLNAKRKRQGKNPANSFWFWGAGTKPALSSFQEMTGKTGAMISAVDLLKGIAVGASMKVIAVDGANGGLNTNYEGKAQAAVEALTKGGCDFVYVHLEAPDEMGHQGSAERKVQAIENLDQRIVRPIVEGLKAAGEEFCMAVLPDHPTPVSIRTHTSDNVPYLLYDSTIEQAEGYQYNEAEAQKTGRLIPDGHKLIWRLFDGIKK